jgi:uncharacterized protein
LLDRREPRHAAVRGALETDRGPFVVPAPILGEVAYMLVRRLGPPALDGFLGDLEDGGFRLDCGDQDLGRIRSLMTRYRSLPLALADAAVIACAERTGSSVLTVDRRDFDLVGRESGIIVVPA